MVRMVLYFSEFTLFSFKSVICLASPGAEKLLSSKSLLPTSEGFHESSSLRIESGGFSWRERAFLSSFFLYSHRKLCLHVRGDLIDGGIRWCGGRFEFKLMAL